MNAATIISDFMTKGVQLAPTDHGTISVTPRSCLTDSDRELLRKHKAEILAELQKVNMVNMVNMVNIDSHDLPPARIVRSREVRFTDATVTCGQCARFQPGTTKMGIGRCLATVNGLPPPGRIGDYKAAFPLARRHCPDYAGALL